MVAKAWGIDLQRWYEIDHDLRAEMVAAYEVENEMRAYDQQLSDKKMKMRQRNKNK